MADPVGMVCTSGQYKGQKIDICVDQAEYTNRRRNQAAAAYADGTGGIDAAKLVAKIPDLNRGVAGYVFPKSRAGFDGPDHPLVDMPGKEIKLDDGRIILGAQELCGLETVEINGKLYRKRLLTPIEWEALASKFGKQDYSTRSGKLDVGVRYDASGMRVVGQAKGHYVEYGGKEVFDMNGSVYEWTFDPATKRFYISGCSWWGYIGLWHLQADYRGDAPLGGYHRLDIVGSRCGVSAQDLPVNG